MTEIDVVKMVCNQCGKIYSMPAVDAAQKEAELCCLFCKGKLIPWTVKEPLKPISI